MIEEISVPTMKSCDFYLNSRADSIIGKVETSRSKWFALKKKLAASAEKIEQLEIKLTRTIQQRDALLSMVEKLLKIEVLDDSNIETDQIPDTANDLAKNAESEIPSSGEVPTTSYNADVCTASCDNEKIINNDVENAPKSSTQDENLISDSQSEPSTTPPDQQPDTPQEDTNRRHSSDDSETPHDEKEIKPFENRDVSVKTEPNDESEILPVRKNLSPLRDSKNRSWECTICDRRFRHPENLAKHIMKIHGTTKSTLRCTRGFISQIIKSLLLMKYLKKRRNNFKPNSSPGSVANKKPSRDQENNVASEPMNNENDTEESMANHSSNNNDLTDTTPKNKTPSCCGLKRSKLRTGLDLTPESETKKRGRSNKLNKINPKPNTSKASIEITRTEKTKMTLRKKSSRYNFRQKK